jgi:hypothetical protein
MRYMVLVEVRLIEPVLRTEGRRGVEVSGYFRSIGVEVDTPEEAEATVNVRDR